MCLAHRCVLFTVRQRITSAFLALRTLIGALTFAASRADPERVVRARVAVYSNNVRRAFVAREAHRAVATVETLACHLVADRGRRGSFVVAVTGDADAVRILHSRNPFGAHRTTLTRVACE